MELIAIYSKVCLKQRIIIPDSLSQELFGAAIHSRGLKLLIANLPYCMLLFIGCIGEDSRDFEFLVTILLLSRQLFVIEFSRIDATHGKHRIEALSTPLMSVRLYPEIREDIA